MKVTKEFHIELAGIPHNSVPFKPCTLPKHVRVELLHREIPLKTCNFPVRDCSVVIPVCSEFEILLSDREKINKSIKEIISKSVN